MQQKVLDGRYELDHKIGEGGMARVYAGRDLRLNRRVAIKIPHRHISGDADFLGRFRHEAQAAAILAHPNIVDVYDVGQDGDIHYIVMEYVEGIDLKTLINREAPLAISRAVEIGQQIAGGLSAAHRAGMVHRDIKPQNVIVTPDGQARITDFGVAKSHLSTALTETGVSFGTVDYISPEQAQGRAATAQSDIYALGVVLYEMLTARLPFKGETAVAVAMKHVTEEPTPPRRLNPQIPAQLEGLILRAMDKDPARRPRSAVEFADLLAGYASIAQQDTMVNPALGGGRTAQRGAPPLQTRQLGGNGASGSGTTGRVSIPPHRQTPARAPRQDGLGCGVFLVGMLLLAGVLGLVLLFGTGALSGLFGSLGGGPRPTAPSGQTGATAVPGEPSATPDLRISVPTLVGLSDGAAQEQLLGLQLLPAPQAQNNPLVSQGLVISQTVAPGELLLPGQAVTYTVSLGPLLVTVPDVRRLSLNLAQSQLTAAGLLVNVVQEPNATIDAGFVFAQAPSPDLRIAQGETVTVRVSLGDVVRFPDVIGMQSAEAEAVLAATTGLELVFIDRQGPDRLANFADYAPGQVVSAQLQGGSGLTNGDLIPRGSKIILGVRAES